MASKLTNARMAFQGLSQKDNPGFTEFTRRIPPKEFAEIEKELAKLKSFEVTQWVYMMRSPAIFQSADFLFKSENAPYLSLQALREEELTIGEVATICRLHSALQHPGAELKMLGDDPKAFGEMLLFSQASTAAAKQLDERPHALALEKLETYFASLMQRSFVDHFYVTVPEEKGAFTVIDRIVQVGTAILLRDQFANRIVASFGMMEEAVKVLTPEGLTSCLPCPVLGLSSLDDIRLGQESEVSRRDMAIPFPGVVYPEMADDHYADEIDFTGHDFYHALQSSQIPHEERKFFIEISRELAKLGCREGLFEPFADLDMGVYRDLYMKPEAHFWRTCTVTLQAFAKEGDDLPAILQVITRIAAPLKDRISAARASIEFDATRITSESQVPLLRKELAMLEMAEKA